MSYIHFKTKTNRQYERITFDGVSLTLPQLKKLLVEKLKFSLKNDMDIQVRNVDTNESRYRNPFKFKILMTRCDSIISVYKDQDSIPKNSRVEAIRVLKQPAPPMRSQ